MDEIALQQDNEKASLDLVGDGNPALLGSSDVLLP